jgi:hypothetical protein
MNQRTLCIGTALAFAACAAPRTSPPPPTADLTGIEKELAQTRDAINHLEGRLNHLESRISAASADDEFTVMTIDAVESAASKLPALGLGQADSNEVLCHVVEWRGFGKMLRFTHLADSHFSLEADGHPSVPATVSEGGVTTADGSLRYVTLSPSGRLEPGVQYQIRPRNENEKYKWSVAQGLTIAAN